ncbi:Ig-like domain-containing protein [Alphaproteobacteria bacterium]|nr:Ig-like domain-containing protein [Alphaproteobacteria bacterium]
MGGVSQQTRITLSGPFYPNDGVTISIDGVSKTLNLNNNTDDGSNIENTRAQVTDFISNNFTGVSVSNSVITSIPNDDGIPQESKISFGGAFYPNDIVYLNIDGVTYNLTMNRFTDSGSNIVNALNQVDTLLNNSVENVESTSVDYLSHAIITTFSDTSPHSVSLSFYDSGNGVNQTALTGSVATTVAASAPTNSIHAYIDLLFSDDTEHNVTVSLTDSGNGSNQSAIAGSISSLAVAQPNNIPVVGDDTGVVQAGKSVNILIGANDSDADGDILSSTITSGPSKGSAIMTDIHGVDYVTYTAGNTTGADSLIYSVSDGSGGLATATITININEAINRAPVANNDSANVVVGQSVQIDIGENDSDIDGDSLISALFLSPLQGTAQLVQSDDSAYIIYTPFSSAVGSDNIAYIISDGNGGTDTATVKIDLFGNIIQGSTLADALNIETTDGLAYGFQGDDLIVGNSGQDIIYGNHDLDTLSGGGGDDVLYGGQNGGLPSPGAGQAADVLAMRDGVEVAYGNDGNDYVYGNIGSDILYGGSGADVLYGGQEADTLSGGIGDDTLVGNRGDDFMVGGLGGDIFVFPPTGHDIVGDFNPLQGDRIDVGDPSLVSISSRVDGSTVLNISGNVDASITLENYNSADFASSYLI